MKKVLIVFPDEWILYSPTILNVISCLKERYAIHIISFDNGSGKQKKLFQTHRIIKINNTLSKGLLRLKLYKLFKFKLLVFSLLYNKIKSPHFQVVFGIDSIGYAATKLFYKNTVFLSLEIKRDFYFSLCKTLGISDLIIQSPERKEYLLDKKDLNIYYLPNSPIVTKQIKLVKYKEKNLILFGNILPENGTENCIKALQLLPEEYTLTLKGIISDSYAEYLLSNYNNLLHRFTIDNSYHEQDMVLDYLSVFYIGFCFYDLSLIKNADFNYISSPAGKLFNYYAAGIPVIANNLLGLKSVQDFRAGLLLSEITPLEISKAILAISDQYNIYQSNALLAAKEFDFNTAFSDFITKYLQQSAIAEN